MAARRLADAGHRVLLVDAGPAATDPAVATIDAVAALDPRLSARSWPGVDATTATGAVVPYRMGRGLGGGSAINTLVAAPGDRADYDRWADRYGCGGWDSASVIPWVDRAVAAFAPRDVVPGPLATRFGEAARAAGHVDGGVSAALDARGVLRASLFAAGATRRSAADVYLADRSEPASASVSRLEIQAEPASASASRLEIRADTTVGRVLVRAGRAVGVELHPPGGSARSGRDEGRGVEVIEADRVVVAAGALQTPALLRRSGVDHPAIGATAEDHPSFVLTVELAPSSRQHPDEPVAPISALVRWSSEDRLGTVGIGRTGDLMALVMDHVGLGSEGRRYGAVIVVLTDVESRGAIPAPSLTDPHRGPHVDPGWLDDPRDRSRLRAGVRHVAGLLSDGAMDGVVAAAHLDDRGTPLDRVAAMDDDELDRWLVAHPGPVSHLGATCPMGSAVAAPVDPAGRVAGIDGLFALDASVLPHLPNGNPQLPIVAVADRLASGIATA